MPFEQIIQNKNFQKLINESIKNKYAIAISGGSDSLGLFHIIKDYLYKNNIYNKPILIIVNHNFREESKLECNFVERLAKFYSFDFAVLNFEKNIHIQKNKQDYARKKRYRLLASYCKKNNIKTLMTAHHLDDQKETILMRLNRGSGPEGLSGISKINIINDIKIVRPLLEIPKFLITKYMSQNNYLWIEDRTNYSDYYERSKIRKKIRKNDLKIEDSAINLLTEKMKNTVDALNFYTEVEYKNIVEFDKNKQIKISKNTFSLLPIEIATRILKKIFIDHGKKKANRILHNTLIETYENILNLNNTYNNSLQFGNFLILLHDNCFLFKKLS